MVLAVATDFTEFCGYLLFLAVSGYKVKEGEHIHDWLFYQQYPFANSCSQGRKMNIFANDRIVFVAGRA